MEKADGKEAVQHGADARVIIEAWRRHFNKVRPHASLGYRAPVPEVFVPALERFAIVMKHNLHVGCSWRIRLA